jgi:sugar phosphate isomerase/epimerase
MARIPVGLQLYSVRDYTANDFVGTLKKVAAMGYAGVEFAGYGGLPAKELRIILDDLGLVTSSSHVPLKDLNNSFDEVVEYNQILGNHFITVPHLPEPQRNSAEAWLNIAARLNNIGAQCKRHGMQLCYHNHAFEFESYDGRYGLEILYGATGTDLLKAELDLYWVKRGGEDPAAYLRKMSGRCPLVHLKDMEPGPEQFFAEVGEGVIDFTDVYAQAEQVGVQWYIVEQDRSRRDTLESVKISIDNLKACGIA